ncbi:MAG TPA: HAMP domain-containing sensor histidine kinase [Methylophilus sp.]|nr:HAMP domain-containing sensor histidine kinase [Methylophilus sp.]
MIAFTLITLFVGGAFSLGINQIIHAMEDELLSNEMDTKLKLIVSNPTHSDTALKKLGLHLFTSDTPEDPHISRYLVNLRYGFTEVESKPYSYYIYHQKVDGQDYTLVQDQSHYEDGFEKNLFIALKSGLLLIVLLGGLVGWLLARQILAPIVKLSKVFAQRKQQSLNETAIVEKFSNDEIGSLAQAFEDTYTKVKDALWRERLFTSDVSHEFRSALMIISSSCELLLQDKITKDAEYERIERIARASAEMQQLIQSLLMIARAEHTAINPTQTQSLEKITDEAFARWQLAFLEKNIAFKVIKKDVLVEKKLNADLLLTVLSNLLKNALNYTESGKVEIILEGHSISVVDTGVGMDLNKQSQMLKPFVRGSALPLDGLGLGLSLIQRICEHQGWRLNVYSEPGRGSTFTIIL